MENRIVTLYRIVRDGSPIGITARTFANAAKRAGQWTRSPRLQPRDRRNWRAYTAQVALRVLVVALLAVACGGHSERSSDGKVREYAPADGAVCYYAWADPAAKLSPCPGDEGGAELTDKRDLAKGFSVGPRYTVLRLEPGACYAYIPNPSLDQTVGVVASDRCEP